MNDDLIERLAEKVHAAWAAEKQRQGFADHEWVTISDRPNQCAGRPHFAPPCELPKHRHHTDMLPYDRLEEHIKEYDRATVRAVLGALDAIGYRVIDAAQAALNLGIAWG